MFTINETNQTSLEIKKSNFISTVFHVNNVDEANEYLKQTKKKYYDATHNCYAYIIGENQDIIKFSDDGEPGQTAGVVIMDAIKKNNLTNVLVIVTRYFGGIKLGAGGLVRAYSDATAKVIKESIISKIEKFIEMKLIVSYDNYNSIINILKDSIIINKEFNENITLNCLVKESNKEETIKKLIEITKNQINIELLQTLNKTIN